MSKWKLSLSTHQPVNPWFSNCDDQHHKPNNFEMAALDSSHKLPSFCILIKAKNEVLVASWKEVATPYFIFAKINLFLVRQTFIRKLRYCSHHHHQSYFSSKSSSSNQLTSKDLFTSLIGLLHFLTVSHPKKGTCSLYPLDSLTQSKNHNQGIPWIFMSIPLYGYKMEYPIQWMSLIPVMLNSLNRLRPRDAADPTPYKKIV